MRKLMAAIAAVLLIGCSIGAASAQTDVEIGVQGGYADWDGLSSESLGVVARVMTPLEDGGSSIGIQLSIAKEFGSVNETVEGLLADGTPVTASGSVEVQWTVDILPTIRFNLSEEIGLTLAAGLTMVDTEAALSVSTSQAAFSGSYSGWYTGWKVAPGIDLAISETTTAVLQLHHASYDVEGSNMTATGGRLGVLFQF